MTPKDQQNQHDPDPSNRKTGPSTEADNAGSSRGGSSNQRGDANQSGSAGSTRRDDTNRGNR